MTAMSGAAEAMQMPTSMLTVMDTSQMENLVVTDRLVSHPLGSKQQRGKATQIVAIDMNNSYDLRLVVEWYFISVLIPLPLFPLFFSSSFSP